MPVQKKKNTSADGWEPIVFQMIAFPTISPLKIEQDWYCDLAGEKAQEITEKRTDRVYSGTYEERILRVTLDLLKISISISPNVISEENTISGFLPTLGPFTPVRDGFLNLAKKWLQGTNLEIKRLAFAGKAVQKTKSHNSAYRLISRYLPAVDLDPKSGDFIYRINRRRKSKSGIKDLEINRLTTWGSAKYSITAGLVGSTEPLQRIEGENFVCMFDFDINSIAEYQGLLPNNRLVRLFSEFAALATEIAEKGDVK